MRAGAKPSGSTSATPIVPSARRFPGYISRRPTAIGGWLPIGLQSTLQRYALSPELWRVERGRRKLYLTGDANYVGKVWQAV